MSDRLDRASFSEQLNTKFQVHIGETDSLEVELVEVTDGGSTPRQERFSIVFRGPRNVLLEQALYKVEHEKMGSFDLFLVPVGMDDEGISYEAVFNHLLK
jgi:hypothetical protein